MVAKCQIIGMPAEQQSDDSWAVLCSHGRLSAVKQQQAAQQPLHCMNEQLMSGRIFSIVCCACWLPGRVQALHHAIMVVVANSTL